MRGGEQRPCKFGPNCNKLATGTCTYYHPPGEVAFQGQNPRQGSGFGHHSSQPRYNSNFQQQGYSQNNPRQPQGNFNPPNNPNYAPNNPNYAPNNPNYAPKVGFKDNISEDVVQKQLCRNFHLGIDCKFGEKCRNKHSFMIVEQDAITRLYFLRNLPFHPTSKLTKFNSGGKDYFALRHGLDINFFDFNFETKALGEVFKYTLPDPNGKYNFYDHKNQFIYYSKENNDTRYDDIGIYNVQLLKHYYLPNSHLGKVTGLAHFDNNVVLSTSMIGELKVWFFQGEELKCHNETTAKLKSCFNPQNAKIELYFVDISEVMGVKVIAVGTSDGRLLLFIGNDLDFKQVQLPEQYSKVFRVRYATRQSVPTALILTWNAAKTVSSVLQIDLVNNLAIRVLLEVRTTQDQPKAMLNLFELVHGYLMVANLHGFVSIYSYPDTSNKLGGIFHQNQVNDIVASEEQLKNTSLKMKIFFILEKRTEQKEGSLAIYFAK